MAIIIRAFNFWAHVSAESTNRDHPVYLSVGSYRAAVQFQKILEKYQHTIKIEPTKNLQGALVTLDNRETTRIPLVKINNDTYILNSTSIQKWLNNYEKEDKQDIIDYLQFAILNNTNNKISWLQTPKLENLDARMRLTRDDKITLPSLQDGYLYGLDEKSFKESVLTSDPDRYSLIKNNCADYVVTALQASDTGKIITPTIDKLLSKTYISLGFARIRNPNIRILSHSVVDFARAMREEILLMTIDDPKNLYTEKAKEQLIDVIKMEINRLEDGANNIQKNSIFAPLRQYTINQKKKKAEILKQTLQVVDDGDVKVILDGLVRNKDLARGITRHKTLDHFKRLQEKIGKPDNISIEFHKKP